MKKICLAAICLVSLFLNTYGIWGGIPSKERLKLLFSNEQEIKDLSAIMKETRDEIYAKTKYFGVPTNIQEDYYDVVVDSKERKMSKYLIGSLRSFLLRSYYPDEHVPLVALGNMNPKNLDFNPNYFSYGGLYIYSVAISLKIASVLNLLTISPDTSYYFLNPSEMGKIFIMGRLIGALMGVLAIYIFYLLGSLLYNKNVGLIAALFLSLTPAIPIFSHYMKPYVFNLPFYLLAFYYAVKILDSDKYSNYILSGIFTGIACGTLIPFGSIFLTILIAHLIKRVSQRRIAILSIFEKRIFLSIIALIVSYLLVNPYILVSIDKAVNEFKFLSRCLPFNLTIEHCFYYFKASLSAGCGWPLLIVITAGFLFSLYKREKKDILLLSFIFPGYLYISATSYNYIHYGLWLLPFLILLGARVIGTGLEKKRIIRWVTLAILLAVSAYTFTYSLACDRLFVEEDIRLVSGKWMMANIEEGASIGYCNQPTPFAAPLVNPFKYKIRWWEKDKWWGEKDLDNNLPQYFVWARNVHQVPEGLKTIINSQYQEIKRFDKPPSIFGIKFKNENEKDYPWSILNPDIAIYKLK
ncbi:MAG: glycosyltransferase family 39 protein [bacterium]|nr:glycosyltransferase family 39 protein [bacterium]